MCSSTCTHWAFGFCFPHTAVPYGHRHISRFILRRSKFHIFVQFGCVFALRFRSINVSHSHIISSRLQCLFFVRFRVSCVRVSERVIVVTVLWIFVAAAKTHKHFKCVFRVHSLVLYRRRGTEPNPYLPHLQCCKVCCRFHWISFETTKLTTHMNRSPSVRRRNCSRHSRTHHRPLTLTRNVFSDKQT